MHSWEDYVQRVQRCVLPQLAVLYATPFISGVNSQNKGCADAKVKTTAINSLNIVKDQIVDFGAI
jgi:hypothetical protein